MTPFSLIEHFVFSKFGRLTIETIQGRAAELASYFKIGSP